MDSRVLAPEVIRYHASRSNINGKRVRAAALLLGILAFALQASGSSVAVATGSTKGNQSSDGASGSGTGTAKDSSQQPSSTPSSGSGGGFSIEAEILAYKSLQSDSGAIACDVARVLVPTSPPLMPNDPNQLASDATKKGKEYHSNPSACGTAIDTSSVKAGIVVVPSTGTAVSGYALWRTDMAIMQGLQLRANASCPAKEGGSATLGLSGPA